jgi:muconolactone delta-isomerase
MLYCIRMDVNVPFGFDKDELEELKAKEKSRAELLQSARASGAIFGAWQGITPISACTTLSITRSCTRLFPPCRCSLHANRRQPLARHPSAIDPASAQGTST